jgi:hypothetical protein
MAADSGIAEASGTREYVHPTEPDEVEMVVAVQRSDLPVRFISGYTDG